MIDTIDLISRINQLFEISERRESDLRKRLDQMRSDANGRLTRQRGASASALDSESTTIQSRWNEKLKKATESDSAINNIHLRMMSSEPKYKEHMKRIGEDIPPATGISIDQALSQLEEMRIAFVGSYKELSEHNVKGSFSKAINSGRANNILGTMAIKRATASGLVKYIIPEIQKSRETELRTAQNKLNTSMMQGGNLYNEEIRRVEKECEMEYAKLADSVLELLSNYIPDEEIDSIVRETRRVWNNIDKVPEKLESTVLMGGISMRLKDYCDNNALVSLVSTKAGDLFGEDYLHLPIVVNLKAKGNNSLIVHGKDENQISTEVLNGMLFAFLLSIPPELLTINIIDPLNKGRSVGPFLTFKEGDSNLLNISTDEDSIQKMLGSISEHISSTIVDKFGSVYSNIWEYNDNNDDNKIGINVLNIFDFPKGFTSKTIEMLNEIILHSFTCGVIVNISYNSEIQMSTIESSNGRVGEIIKLFNCKYKVSGDSVTHLQTGLAMSPMTLPQQSALNDFIRRYESVAMQKRKQSHVVSFFDICGEIFKRSATSGITLPIGMEEREIVNIEFGRGTSHHMLIAGAIGSGKSSLLHTIINSAIYNYPPEDVNLFLMDFKSGTEFKVYDRRDIPHIKLLAIDAMQEFGESILKELCDEISRRSNFFKDTGQQDLSGYINATGKKIPRILVIIDEFQTLFDEGSNRAVAGRCAAYLGEIVAKGRSYGIHLIMATQTMKVTTERTALKNSTIEQMRSRIGLQCGEFDAKFLFKESSDEAIKEMRGPIGRAVYAWDYMQDQIKGLNVSYLPDDQKLELLKMVASRSKGSVQSNIRVFEGRRKIPMPDITSVPNGHLLLPIGEPVSVSPPLSLDLNLRGRNNIFLAGNNEKVMIGLENIINYGLNHNSNVDIYLINGREITGESTNKQDFNLPVKKSASSDNEIIGLICDVYDKMTERKNNSVSLRYICLYILDLQWIEIIKKMMKGDRVYAHDFLKDLEVTSDRNDTVTTKLLSIIREGNKYGIFTVITTRNPGDATAVMRYQEQLLKEMGHCLATSLNEKDGETILGPGIICMDDDDVAYYSDGAKPALMFKPYHLEG